MPLRKRQPKVGLTRMDAALDAMRPLGFPEAVVRQSIKNLLEVYGEGDSGWVFIEEYAYKLLIDIILEKQEKEESQSELKQEQMEEETVLSGESGAVSSVGSCSCATWEEVSTTRRKPCYGWISGSDEEDDGSEDDF